MLSQVCSGLRFRLLVLVMLTCAPLVLLVVHTAGEDRRRAVAEWRQRSQRLVETAQRQDQELVDGTRQLLLAISESSSVRALNGRSCQKWLEELLGVYTRYANLGVLKTNGTPLASAVPGRPAPDPAAREFFRRVLQTHTFAIGSFPAVSTNRPTLSFGYPVLGYSGELIAVVYAELDLNWFQRVGSELPRQLLPGATWTELDRHGTIFARLPAPEGWIGQRLPERGLLPVLLREPEGVVEMPGAKGVPHFYAYNSMRSPLVGRDVIALLGIPRQILFAEADRVLQRNLLLLGIAASLVLVLGFTGSKLLILRPVRVLAASTARLAAGDLTVRTGLPPARDELGQLMRSFDQMAQTLEQREAERQRASHRLEVLSQRLVEAQETERRLIARELHDEIGQSLTVAELNLQAALRTHGGDAVQRRLQESIRAVERVLEQVHDLCLNLRPSMLDDLGLEPTLRDYTRRQAELKGMCADFRAEPLQARLDPVIETECFRVAQEALTNIVRHAAATKVTVRLTRNEGQLHLMVRDDGRGFDVEEQRLRAVRGASLGLLSMQERAVLAGGGVEIKSGAGQGTSVHAWFPLRWRDGQLLSVINE